MVRVRVFEPEPAPGRSPRPAADAGPVAFVGAGQMGAPMVRRLLRAGIEVTLYARRPRAFRSW